MKNPRYLVALALLALLAAGCSQDDSPGDIAVDDYDAMDLEQAYGGLTMTDEQPAFDDPYLIAEDAQDEGDAFADPVADDPEVREMERRGHGNRFTYVRIVWGELDAARDEPDGDVVDWTGSLHVDRGVLIVRRVILFERPGDNVVRPRPDRQTVAWTSHTGGHFDGLVIQIIERPQDIEGGEPNQLHFTTGPLTTSFPVADLAGLDQISPSRPKAMPSTSSASTWPTRTPARGASSAAAGTTTPPPRSRAASSAAAGSACTASPRATCAAATA